MQVPHSPETSPGHSQQLLNPRKPGWRVFLGRAAWSRYTYERPESDQLMLLGSVSKGAQVGALAMTVEGEYVQVVGDYMVSFHRCRVPTAMPTSLDTNSSVALSGGNNRATARSLNVYP